LWITTGRRQSLCPPKRQRGWKACWERIDKQVFKKIEGQTLKSLPEKEARMSDVVDMLNADIRDEHAAIIQYLQHAYAIGESGEACEIEAIARDEMRHLHWLSDAVVELGGDPTIGRSEVDLSGAGPVEWMARDIMAEERAIAQYKEHIAAIDDPKIVRLLQRILSDEEAHRDQFADLADELAEESVKPMVEDLSTATASEPSQAAEILQQGVQHEYTVILQYLYHEFVTPDCEVGEELRMQAINEMQHMGWFSEELASAGVRPEMEHTEVDLARDTAAMLEADIAAERAVTTDYTQQIGELDDEELKALLARVRDHEVYHDAVFSEMLEEVLESRKKEGSAPEKAVEKAPPPPPKAEEPPSPPSPLGKFTVGSLVEKE
jgi:bacterioferritin